MKNPVPGPTDCVCINGEHIRKWPIQPDSVIESSPMRPSERPNRNDISEQGPSKVKNETPNGENSLSSSTTENHVENKPFPNLGTNSDQPGPSTFSSHQSVKESGNTSPKPFYSSYTEYSSHNSSGSSENSGLKKKSQNKSLSEMAECCKFGSVCLASITKNIIIEIRQKCTNLRDLRLEYCNLNCNSVIIISSLY